MPPKPISTAVINPTVPKEEIRPFARLQFDLIRTYRRTYNTEPTVDVTETEEGGDPGEELITTTTTAAPVEVSVEITSEESDPNCPMSGWDDWLECEGACVDNRIEGYQMRFRHHIVNNQPVDLYGPMSKRIPKECIDKYSVNELRACTDSCDEEESEES